MRLIEHGDIWTDDADVLVVPVNCVGVLGAGLAREAKRRFPTLEPVYRALCRHASFRPGGLVVLEAGEYRLPRSVALATTKDHWRDPSQLEWVATICVAMDWADRPDGRSWAVPALGCGHGGLPWSEVLAIMEHALARVDARVYPPRGR